MIAARCTNWLAPVVMVLCMRVMAREFQESWEDERFGVDSTED